MTQLQSKAIDDLLNEKKVAKNRMENMLIGACAELQKKLAEEMAGFLIEDEEENEYELIIAKLEFILAVFQKRRNFENKVGEILDSLLDYFEKPEEK